MVIANFGGLFLQFGSIIDVLFQLENLGFFAFVLPFLLVFAIIYGILQAVHIFGDNKAVHIIIGVVLGLMSIRLPFFADFLTEVTPRLGVGLTILLVLLILVGLFTPKKSTSAILWILFAVGAIIAIVVIVQTSNVLGYLGIGAFSSEIIGWIVMIAVLIGVIVAVVAGKGEREGGEEGYGPLWPAILGQGKPPK